MTGAYPANLTQPPSGGFSLEQPMAAETAAASSPAEVVDVFNGETPTLVEYNSYRQSGELPARFKPAEQQSEAATDDTQEQAAESEGDESESASESESEEEVQEQPQKKESAAEKRIKQLNAQKKAAEARAAELERRLAAQQDGKLGSSPARPQPPQNYADYRKAFKPSEWITEYAKANPEASYEDANAAMADHLLDVREHFRKIEERVSAERQALEAKVSEARERYDDFDEIKAGFLAKTVGENGAPLIPLQVLSIINDSDNLPDVLYTIGSDETELDKFVAMAKANPNKAIRYVARVESLIAEELAKPAQTQTRGEDGKFTKQAPEKRQTAAPKPPSPVGGASSRAFDVNDESLSPAEWMRKRNEQLSRR